MAPTAVVDSKYQRSLPGKPGGSVPDPLALHAGLAPCCLTSAGCRLPRWGPMCWTGACSSRASRWSSPRGLPTSSPWLQSSTKVCGPWAPVMMPFHALCGAETSLPPHEARAVMRVTSCPATERAEHLSADGLSPRDTWAAEAGRSYRALKAARHCVVGAQIQPDLWDACSCPLCGAGLP